MFEGTEYVGEEAEEDDSVMTLKDFVTANPEDLCFGSISDKCVEIIDEANGKIGCLEIDKLQYAIQEYIKGYANNDDLPDILL